MDGRELIKISAERTAAPTVTKADRRSVKRFTPPAPKRSAFRDPRRRRIGAGVLFALVVVLGVLGFRLQASAVVAAPVPPVSPGPPSLAALDTAIARAEPYIAGLYKPVDDRTATLSDFYGLPLRVYLNGYRQWILLGEDENAFCGLVGCARTTQISEVVNRYRGETFLVEFRSIRAGQTPLVRVDVDWDYDANDYQVSLTNLQFGDRNTSALVFLDSAYLGVFDSGNVGQSLTLTIDKSRIRPLQSLRYTLRHGNQIGESYFRYMGLWEQVRRLDQFLIDWNFHPDYDIHAPIWGRGEAYPDDMPFTVDPQDGYDVYHDCAVSTTRNPLNYPYESKVCKFRPDMYALLSRSDTLVPSVQAMHLLNKYGAASVAAATRVARSLESQFDRTGMGISMCVGPYCDYSAASGIRTFEFGALETLLGYDYGDARSRTYADRIASLALRVQVGDDDIVHIARQGAYYRPALRGSFYLAWTGALEFPPDKPLAYQVLNNLFEMPPEYKGVVTSNMETTNDGFAFLVGYRCKRYRVACPAGP